MGYKDDSCTIFYPFDKEVIDQRCIMEMLAVSSESVMYLRNLQ